MMENTTLVALMDNKDFVVKMLSQETPEDVQKLFCDNGVELTMDQIHALGRELDRMSQSGDELDAEALEAVSGGVIDPATAWLIAKCVIAVGSAALAIYKWYKSR